MLQLLTSFYQFKPSWKIHEALRRILGIVKLYDLVRVIKLLRPIEDYDSFGKNRDASQNGNTGTFIELLHAQNLPDPYAVEMSDIVGNDGWLSEFLKDELEPV